MSDPSPVWLVQAANTHVQKRFFAALDAVDRPCWTDDAKQAKRFPLSDQARQWARQAWGRVGWSLVHA